MVWDPGDRATDEQVAEIYDTFADFAAWTGVDTVCSPGVKIHPMIRGGGRTTLAGGWLHLDPQWLPEIRQATTHELCHAWDIQHGYLSLEHHEIFDGRDIEPGALYPLDSLRRMESFALACGDGAMELGVARGIDQVCDLSLLSEAQRFVQDQVFSEHHDAWPWLGETEIRLERRTTDSVWADTMAAAGAEIIALQLRRIERPEVAGWSAVSGPPEQNGSAQRQYGYNVLERIDPWTAEVVSRIRLPTDDWDPSSWRLLDGDPEPLLVRITAERSQAWLVHADDTLEEVYFPCLGSMYQFDGGVVREHRAWLSLFDEERGWGLLDLDLDSGAEIAFYEHLDPWWIQDLGAELVMMDGGFHPRLVWLDPDTGHTRSRSMEGAESIEAARMLSDGRLAVLLGVYADSLPLDPWLPALFDLDASGWYADPATCTAPRIEYPNPNAGTGPRLLLVDGELWLFERVRHGWDWKPSLTRIAFGVERGDPEQ